METSNKDELGDFLRNQFEKYEPTPDEATWEAIRQAIPLNQTLNIKLKFILTTLLILIAIPTAIYVHSGSLKNKTTTLAFTSQTGPQHVSTPNVNNVHHIYKKKSSPLLFSNIKKVAPKHYNQSSVAANDNINNNTITPVSTDKVSLQLNLVDEPSKNIQPENFKLNTMLCKQIKSSFGSIPIPNISLKSELPSVHIKTNKTEFWFSVTPSLNYQNVTALPQPEIGYLIDMLPQSRFAKERMGIQLNLNVRKKIFNNLIGQMSTGYIYTPLTTEYEWFTGEFKVIPLNPNGILIQRNAIQYSENLSVNSFYIGGALRYQRSTKKFVPVVELGTNYQISSERSLTSIQTGLDWPFQNFSVGLSSNYYMTSLTDKQKFLKINPYSIGIKIGWKIK